MVQVGVALIATLVALVGTGVVLSRAFDQRRSHLFGWALTLFGMTAALGAIAVGLLAGFSGALFRAMELGGALIAPLWLATGMVELVTRHVPVRFGTRLVVVSYSIVAVVILALDPLRGRFDAALPRPEDHYEWLPQAVLAGSHLIAVATLVGCAAVTALRARDMDRQSYDVLLPVALIALAGVLIVSASRGYLPDAAAVFALAGAAVLIWFGAVRTIPAQSDEDGYTDAAAYDERRVGRYQNAPENTYQNAPENMHGSPPGSGYGIGYGNAPGNAYDNGYPNGYDGDGRSRHRRAAAAEPLSAPPPPVPGSAPFVEVGPAGMPGAPPPMPPIPQGAYGQITVYTLLDGREAAFDRLSRDAVQAAQHGEPGTLIYACHEVVGAPTQRIFYQLFRDQPAYDEHQRQPYVRHFLAESRSHVIATNIIELRLDAAKVLPQSQLSEQQPWPR